MSEVREISTADGSTTLECVRRGWSFRSRNGAQAESEHVFVQGSRILASTSPSSPRRVLEIGLGGAGNFATTVQAYLAAPDRAGLVYVAIEVDPVPGPFLCAQAPWLRPTVTQALEDGEASLDDVTLCVLQGEFPRCGASLPHLGTRGLTGSGFGAIYFDPFSPREQPESWSLAAFQRCYELLAPEGRWVTYASAGWVRRALASVGFYVARVPGATGKRHATVAVRSPAALQPHERVRHEPP